ncbi:hypothetical protein OCGS_2666 [Oceaniovalibus guishaninsula JLT2003]|uniref:VPLPA-CTERM protein sorting domain-containing protein n=1 Tax=Oceaniovalibus guishaninsula JLT2003 TaxID=1231392 RepID=K2I2J2_9RHOB|nr:VPLPA-CTERM sorting domain-containing protein [Oceaniovalibus guishaninsula]EKE43075.1 hypothetical protein OCGS_2666 [Oceaniovalibus guishaninsula JLT2003]
MFLAKILAAGVAALALAVPAGAATFTFAGTVSGSPGPAAMPDAPDFPPLGAAGSVTLFIDDSDPSLDILDALDMAFFAGVSVSVPGYVAGSADYNPFEPARVSRTGFGFSAYGPTDVFDPGAWTFLSQGLNGIGVTFPTLASAPGTVGELVAALSQPGVTGRAFAEAEREGGGGFYTTFVSFPAAPPAVVPLPAAGWLLIGGLGALAALRRRPRAA